MANNVFLTMEQIYALVPQERDAYLARIYNDKKFQRQYYDWLGRERIQTNNEERTANLSGSPDRPDPNNTPLRAERYGAHTNAESDALKPIMSGIEARETRISDINGSIRTIWTRLRSEDEKHRLTTRQGAANFDLFDSEHSGRTTKKDEDTKLSLLMNLKNGITGICNRLDKIYDEQWKRTLEMAAVLGIAMPAERPKNDIPAFRKLCNSVYGQYKTYAETHPATHTTRKILSEYAYTNDLMDDNEKLRNLLTEKLVLQDEVAQLHLQEEDSRIKAEYRAKIDNIFQEGGTIIYNGVPTSFRPGYREIERRDERDNRIIDGIPFGAAVAGFGVAVAVSGAALLPLALATVGSFAVARVVGGIIGNWISRRRHEKFQKSMEPLVMQQSNSHDSMLSKDQFLEYWCSKNNVKYSELGKEGVADLVESEWAAYQEARYMYMPEHKSKDDFMSEFENAHKAQLEKLSPEDQELMKKEAWKNFLAENFCYMEQDTTKEAFIEAWKKEHDGQLPSDPKQVAEMADDAWKDYLVERYDGMPIPTSGRKQEHWDAFMTALSESPEHIAMLVEHDALDEKAHKRLVEHIAQNPSAYFEHLPKNKFQKLPPELEILYVKFTEQLTPAQAVAHLQRTNNPKTMTEGVQAGKRRTASFNDKANNPDVKNPRSFDDKFLKRAVEAHTVAVRQKSPEHLATAAETVDKRKGRGAQYGDNNVQIATQYEEGAEEPPVTKPKKESKKPKKKETVVENTPKEAAPQEETPEEKGPEQTTPETNLGVEDLVGEEADAAKKQADAEREAAKAAREKAEAEEAEKAEGKENAKGEKTEEGKGEEAGKEETAH